MNSTHQQIFSKSSQQLWSLWLVAIIWNSSVGVGIVKAQQGILAAFDTNPIFYFFLIFPLLGLWLLFQAIKQTIAGYKFGKTPVILNPYPGQIGGYCAGHLNLPIAEKDVQHAILSLSCMHRYHQRKNSGKQRLLTDVLWQDSLSVTTESHGSHVRINFSFTLPDDLPATATASHESYVWTLQVRLPLPGIDYERTFELPVQAASAQTLDLFNQTQPIQEDDPAPETSSLPKIKHSSTGGTQFYYGYGRSKGIGIFLVLLGVILSRFGYSFFAGFMSILPATTVLFTALVGAISLTLVLLGLFLIFNSLTIEVNILGVRKQQRILGYLLEEIISFNDIVDIVIEQNTSTTSAKNTRIWYRLNLITRNGQNIEVGDSLEGHSYAKQIREYMLEALSHSWHPATPDNMPPKGKKKLPAWFQRIGKLVSFAIPVMLIYDLVLKLPEILVFLGHFFPTLMSLSIP